MTPLSVSPAPTRPRSLRSLLLGWPGRVLLILIVVIVVGYWFENWRGARALQAELDIMREKGLATDWRDLLRGPVPDADNFGATPSLKGLAGIVVRVIPGMEPVQWDAIRFPQPQKPEDWKVIRELLPKSNYFNPPAAEANDARAVFLALDRMEPVFAELAAAAGRPVALFTPSPKERYDAGIENMMIWPAASFVHNGLTRLCEIRATAAVALGEGSEALRMIRILRRLYEAAQLIESPHVPNPFLAGITAEGLRGHRWNAAQLDDLTRLLSLTDPASAVAGSYHRFMLWDAEGMLNAANSKVQFPSTKWWRTRVPPSGWVDQKRAELFRVAREQLILPLRQHGVAALVNGQAGAREEDHHWLSPWPQFDEAIRNMVLYGEMMRRLTILGLAAEQHRLKTGKFPGEIAPILTALPPNQQADLDGKPLRLETSKDGKTFSLYSVGENLRDDGNAPPESRTAPSKDYDWGLFLPVP